LHVFPVFLGEATNIAPATLSHIVAPARARAHAEVSEPNWLIALRRSRILSMGSRVRGNDGDCVPGTTALIL
jgi:hypothetical protein